MASIRASQDLFQGIKSAEVHSGLHGLGNGQDTGKWHIAFIFAVAHTIILLVGDGILST